MSALKYPTQRKYPTHVAVEWARGGGQDVPSKV
jgi:hypothetical protein